MADRVQDWFFLRRVRKEVVQLLKARRLQRVLDLCCGAGALSRRLADAGLSPVALDTSPTMLARAAARAARAPRFPVILGDARRVPLRPGFDAAVLSLALHEMDPDARETVWAEMHRVVRPGGLLVIVDYLHAEGSGLIARLARSYTRFDERQMGRIHPPHYANYLDFIDQGGLSAWLRARGASVVAERRYLGGTLGLLAVSRL